MNCCEIMGFTILNAGQLQHEFNETQGTIFNGVTRPSSYVQWLKPDADTIKINLDGACRSTDGAAAVGVAQDNNGQVLAGCSKLILSATYASLIEGDAANVIHMLKDPREDISTLASYLTDARRMIRQHSNLTVNYIL
ncbi:hypothetical protein V6N13_051451 [Hibiscus sabdariffa]